MTHLRRLALFAQHCWTFVLHFAHGSLVMAGVLVVGLLGFQFLQHGASGLNLQELLLIKPSVAAQIKQEVPVVEQTSEVALKDDEQSGADISASELFAWTHDKNLSPDFVRIAQYIARRYKVSQLIAEPLVAAAVREGRATGIDPLLILAVTSIESRFNPLAESVVGAQGLMQIIPRYHGDKISSQKGPVALFDPDENFRVGALILKEYIGNRNSLGSALQQYGGALGDSSMGYSTRVLGEMERLRRVMKFGDEQQGSETASADKITAIANEKIVAENTTN